MQFVCHFVYTETAGTSVSIQKHNVLTCCCKATGWSLHTHSHVFNKWDKTDQRSRIIDRSGRIRLVKRVRFA